MKIKLLLIDALNLIRRVYAAQPGDDGPNRVDDALKTSVHSLQRALRECRPTHAICVFDGHEPSWRHSLYPEYKAGRTPMPEVLDSNMNRFMDAFSEAGARSVCFPALEADDVIATLAGKVASRSGNVVILSTDRLFLQLVSDLVVARDHFQRVDMDRTHVQEKLHVRPDQVVDLFALAGYATNNIPGVPTVGIKTAAKLLGDLETLDTILSVAHTIKGKLGETLYRHAEEARLSQSLVRLKDTLELGLNLKSFRYTSQ
ncbi:MAG: flap endonuclease Xni [Deltaproteobacteria bacterium]|nr:flap endonuclease Xni [Deltaproteobacteria bacterium]MBW2595037.1 flap endonuclease Xni [Deltaproteobacteria bacterium]MBW2649969.1 flap endonuclease Xni [Deltaproteobacteria bacterium]